MVDRVVSLAPSATSTIQSLGAADRLVGATVHGDHDVPVIGGWLNPDLQRIEALEPDLIVTTDTLQSTVVNRLRDRGYRPLHLTPQTLDDVMTSIERLGRALGTPATARTVVGDMEAAFDRLRTDAAGAHRPVVYCEEWSDPPMAAGNWVPELVELAGGRYPFLEPGERSRAVEGATVEGAQPAHVILHICGRGTAVDPATVLDREWAIPAIEQGNVHVIDDRLLNQPAPTLVDGAEAIRAAIEAGKNAPTDPSDLERA